MRVKAKTVTADRARNHRPTPRLAVQWAAQYRTLQCRIFDIADPTSLTHRRSMSGLPPGNSQLNLRTANRKGVFNVPHRHET